MESTKTENMQEQNVHCTYTCECIHMCHVVGEMNEEFECAGDTYDGPLFFPDIQSVELWAKNGLLNCLICNLAINILPFKHVMY